MYLQLQLEMLPFLFITVAIVAAVAVVERKEKPFIDSVVVNEKMIENERKKECDRMREPVIERERERE